MSGLGIGENDAQVVMRQKRELGPYAWLSQRFLSRAALTRESFESERQFGA
jgi:hypothetical protein